MWLLLIFARRKIGADRRLDQRLLAYFANSRERRVAASTASVMSSARPCLPISTCRAAKVVPLGDVTLSRSALGGAFERWMSSPAPETVCRASFMADRGRGRP